MSSRPGHDSRRCGLAPTGAMSKSATGASRITAGTRLRGSESSILRRKVARQVVKEFEFAKDGEIGSGAEGLLEFGQGGDFVAQQVPAEDLGVEGEGSHNVAV